jgi:hypothetical protein
VAVTIPGMLAERIGTRLSATSKTAATRAATFIKRFDASRRSTRRVNNANSLAMRGLAQLSFESFIDIPPLISSQFLTQ